MRKCYFQSTNAMVWWMIGEIKNNQWDLHVVLYFLTFLRWCRHICKFHLNDINGELIFFLNETEIFSFEEGILSVRVARSVRAWPLSLRKVSLSAMRSPMVFSLLLTTISNSLTVSRSWEICMWRRSLDWDRVSWEELSDSKSRLSRSISEEGKGTDRESGNRHTLPSPDTFPPHLFCSSDRLNSTPSVGGSWMSIEGERPPKNTHPPPDP